MERADAPSLYNEIIIYMEIIIYIGGTARRSDVVERAVVASLAAGVRDAEALERDVRRAAGKFVSDRTKRRPMIVPVVMGT